MRRKKPKQYLDPDGVVIEIDWNKFLPETSVFIPAINISRLVHQFYSVTNYNRWLVHHTERIEKGKLGVRFWRLL